MAKERGLEVKVGALVAVISQTDIVGAVATQRV